VTAADDRAAQIRARLAAGTYARRPVVEGDVIWLLAELDEFLRRVEQAERAGAADARAAYRRGYTDADNGLDPEGSL
jgi:hypothetical protein